MDYNESIEWLFAQLPMFSRVGAAAYKPGLERSEALAEFFGHPERKFRSVHVAGTNGKGSVSSLIAATLQASGYKTALYTSPHLVDFRERMRINGRMVPQHKVVDFVSRWKAGEYQGDRPSFFELTMMMAFEWFADENVDVAVIEVGMGGRLDSTNIITPDLCVITNISKDHTQFLGDTPEKIAKEKAGIIKPGIKAVIGEATAETAAVFQARAKEVGTELREAYREENSKHYDALECGLTGPYQIHNINTALAAVEELRNMGWAIPDKAVRTGFRDVTELTGLRGRWTVVNEMPFTVCDTGHNEAGLSSSMGKVREMMSSHRGAKLRMVFGMVADKDVDHILRLLPPEGVYYVTQAQIPRAMPWETLLGKMQANGFKASGYNSVSEAFNAASSEASDTDIIYIGGSTFIVADYFKDRDSRQ